MRLAHHNVRLPSGGGCDGRDDRTGTRLKCILGRKRGILVGGDEQRAVHHDRPLRPRDLRVSQFSIDPGNDEMRLALVLDRARECGANAHRLKLDGDPASPNNKDVWTGHRKLRPGTSPLALLKIASRQVPRGDDLVAMYPETHASQPAGVDRAWGGGVVGQDIELAPGTADPVQ